MAGRDSAQRNPLRSTSPRRSVNLGIDVPLLLTVITLIVFGLLMVYSASSDYSMMVLGEAPTFMFTRQLMWLSLGIVTAIVLTWLDYHRWQKLAIPVMIVAILALVGVLFVNEVINNATRTILGGSGQPSELGKLVIIIYLAVWLYAKRDQLSVVSFGIVPLGAILGLMGGLIFLQPDLSAATTIFILGGILFFLAGGDLRQIALLLILGLVVGWMVFRFHPTGSQRVADYLVSLKDFTQAPLHLSRSLEALVKGGWIGVGIGRADTKLTGLPVPPTDSIFAVVAEETGLFGAASVIGLYVLLMWRGLKIAQKAPDGLGKLLAAGLSLWIAVEALINMAVIVGLLPFAGNALPFISAGGSNLVVSLAAIGILLNISRMSARTRENEARTLDAVVDLRWRNRRRGISRTRRTESVHRR
ncbi:MAG TPA: putative peptidoglycan glycosyltransferase FtsW [Anaerolineales bacterium]|nr:putative peptidoglycan glycosyltransferase FtsW [Anaerolineales bacterium]